MNEASPPRKSDERRRQQRVAARFQVRFEAPEEAARALRAYSINVSVGGLCLKTGRAYGVGVALLLHMQVGDDKFDLDARVAWVRPGVIGVRFMHVPPDVQLRLDRVVDRFAGKAPPSP